ncbi:MAG: sulfatase-like hydrolase/transferase [Bacteroidia bacterium]|nr:sulfatase-like hydrolase/transferase [Bacteroidia bacterium]
MRIRTTILLSLLMVVISPLLAQKIKPNVVLILTDDQGWGDLSLHGNTLLETPHLDQLAKDGTRFNNFYVSPLCAPSRASILTGRYHLKTGVVSVSKSLEIMDGDETTLAELFKANGYQTGIFGKWHNGQHYPNHPNNQGFDEFLGFCAGHLSNYFDTVLERNGKSVKTKGFITDVLTDGALQFIASNKSKQFFCYIPYNAPHSPHQVPDNYFNKHKTKGLDNELSSIYGMVENIDDNVGRILNFLKQNNLDENTIVIFLTDNGPNGIRYNGNMKGIKGSVHEGGVRVPFFIKWKNQIPAGKIIQIPAAHIDIYPTLIELCHLNPISAKPIDGVSLATMIWGDNETPEFDRKLFTHVNFIHVPAMPNSGGFRSNQYRFVYEKSKPQLYDVTKDPTQEKDIANQNIELTNQLSKEYLNWFSQSSEELIYERQIVLTANGAELPVYEASLSAGIKFKEGHGWAHDWVKEWSSTKDSLSWEIDCQLAGQYDVEIFYQCEKSEVGSTIEVQLGNEKRNVIVKDAFYSKQVPSPDRIVRKEAYEMGTWKSLPVGTFAIQEGRHILKMKAINIKNTNVAEVKGLELKFNYK